MNFFDLFSQVRLINLRSRPDRLQECKEEFRKHRLNTDKVKNYLAVKPGELPSNWQGVLGLGVYGCFTSHLTVLKEFADSGRGRLLVMEDDIRFMFNPTDLGVPEDADIVYFGRLNQPAPHTDSRWITLDPTDGVIGLHCYSVNRRTALRLVQYLEQVISREDGHPLGGVQHVDGAVSMFRAQNTDIKTVLCSPYLAAQRSSATDLHESNLTQLSKLPVIGLALAYARKIKNKLAS